MEEDLEHNRFYKELQTNYPKLYQTAQDSCYVICVPQQAVLKDVSITKQMMEAHVLKPSPYFAGEYHGVGKGKQVVGITGKEIKTKSGYDIPTTTTILSEELGYNSSYNTYRVLCVGAVLGLGDKQVVHKDNGATEFGDFLTPRHDFEAHVTFVLAHLREKGIINLTTKIRQFSSSYVVVRGYLTDVVDKVNSIVDAGVGWAMEGSDALVEFDESMVFQALQESMEVYVLDRVYAKVFDAVLDDYQRDVTAFKQRIEKFSRITATEVGLKEEFACNLTPASQQLCGLAHARSPFSKLECLKSTFDTINTLVGNHMKLKFPKSKEVLTADDMLPLLALVMLKGGPPDLPVHMTYIAKFGRNLSPDFSYYNVTVQAALEYVMNNAFPQVQPVHQETIGSRRRREAKEKEPIRLSETGSFTQLNARPSSKKDEVEVFQPVPISTKVPLVVGAPRRGSDYFKPDSPTKSVSEKEMGGFLTKLSRQGFY